MTTNIIDRIKSFEDAKNATGRPDVPAFTDVPEDMREYLQAHYKMVVIAEALNEGKKLDWNNSNQPKWYPWFYNPGVSSGFVFDDTNCRYSSAHAGDASRLCFSTEALAEYAGKQFLDIWNTILMK